MAIAHNTIYRRFQLTRRKWRGGCAGIGRDLRLARLASRGDLHRGEGRLDISVSCRQQGWRHDQFYRSRRAEAFPRPTRLVVIFHCPAAPVSSRKIRRLALRIGCMAIHAYRHVTTTLGRCKRSFFKLMPLPVKNRLSIHHGYSSICLRPGSAMLPSSSNLCHWPRRRSLPISPS